MTLTSCFPFQSRHQGNSLVTSKTIKIIFSRTTLRKNRNLAPVSMERREEQPKNSLSRDRKTPRVSEECITQVSEEIKITLKRNYSETFSEQRTTD